MDESSMSFSNFGLPKEINGAIKDLGYKAPTPIQAQTLPHSLNGEDIIGQAQTGTGKTAAFLISILTYELENPPEEDRPPGSPFALIIAPTRELVLQIQKDAEGLAKRTNINSLALVGGIDYEKQKIKLTKIKHRKVRKIPSFSIEFFNVSVCNRISLFTRFVGYIQKK